MRLASLMKSSLLFTYHSVMGNFLGQTQPLSIVQIIQSTAESMALEHI